MYFIQHSQTKLPEVESELSNTARIRSFAVEPNKPCIGQDVFAWSWQAFVRDAKRRSSHDALLAKHPERLIHLLQPGAYNAGNPINRPK